MRAIFWFGRDRRLQDNEALTEASEFADEILPVFVVPADFDSLSGLRQHSLVESLVALHESIPNGLHVQLGSAPEILAELAQQSGATKVFATKAYDPAGIALQQQAVISLREIGVELELIGSYYAVLPGTVLKEDKSPLRVYTPFYRRWVEQSVAAPFELNLGQVKWLAPLSGSGIPKPTKSSSFRVLAGEEYALQTWRRFKQRRLFDYGENRNRPDLNGTSNLSHALAHGEIHPRTLLAGLGNSPGEEVFRKEIAWREFYADVLFHNQHTTTEYFEPKFARMRYDDPVEFKEKLDSWKTGRTGYPIVDAAMRQLVSTGWMHNRSRMVVASFLVKDLHFEWQLGAEFFEQHLTDFDPASNAHGWQWTAGCGTDASPYYRVFNPVLQGLKFDPNGDYVRKWIPELAHLPGASVHEPWNDLMGYQFGYPAPVVDHALERQESLARLEELKV